MLTIFTFDANFVSVANEEYGMWMTTFQSKWLKKITLFTFIFSAICLHLLRITIKSTDCDNHHQNFNAKRNNITIDFSPPINLQTLKLTLKLFLWHVITTVADLCEIVNYNTFFTVNIHLRLHNNWRYLNVKIFTLVVFVKTVFIQIYLKSMNNRVMRSYDFLWSESVGTFSFSDLWTE